MISVCIPVYNYDVTDLAESVLKQIEQIAQPAELIIIDDGSDSDYKYINKHLIDQCNYIDLHENIGRAKVRNLFLKYARYDYLLFLDCDSIIEHPDFLKIYVNETEADPDVVCGGRVYPAECPGSNKKLRWKYGVFRESKSHLFRKKSPNSSFMANNFMVKKTLFKKIQFNEQISQYGHEDTLFGYNLTQHNITVDHIDNPVLNGDIENNSEFLRKTKKAIENLVLIVKLSDDADGLKRYIRILKFYEKYEAFGWLLRPLFFMIKPFIVVLLSNGIVSLGWFDFYKLGELFSVLKKDNAIVKQK